MYDIVLCVYERFRVDGLKRYVKDDRFRVDGDKNMRLLAFAFTIVFVWTGPKKKRYSFARRFDTKTFVLIPFKQTTGAGRGTTIYMGYIGMCHCEGYGFQTVVYFGIGYINQRVWVLNTVSFSRKLINCLKILVLTKGTRNYHSKIY